MSALRHVIRKTKIRCILHTIGEDFFLNKLSLTYVLTCILWKAKCRYLKKLTCKGTVWQVFICLRSRTPYPPLHIQYTCIQYTYSHRGGEGERGGVRGRGESWTREKVWGATVHKAGSKKYQHDWLYLQSINSDKYLPQSHFTGHYF